MNIGGFQKLTLIDYPGKLATTVFTVGCSFRCPFCHNPELVLGAGCDLSVQKEKQAEFFQFLKKRKDKLQGVCITGGEPTIQPDIIEFIRKIKKMGFLVKLDTNGSRPDVLKKIIELGIVDYIAMDIKNQLKKYAVTTGVKIDKERIRLSVEMIMNSSISYQFRTTVVPGIHTQRDFLEIAKWISGAREFWLQKYEETKILDPGLKQKTKNKKIDLEKIKEKIEKHFGKVGIR
jgi:pyruvate formate lyase activating enzyme